MNLLTEVSVTHKNKKLEALNLKPQQILIQFFLFSLSLIILMIMSHQNQNNLN